MTKSYTPMQTLLYARWINIWHTLYLGGLLAGLLTHLWDARQNLGSRDFAVIVIILLMAVFYYQLFVAVKGGSFAPWQSWLYFAICFLLWAVLLQISHSFSWLIWAFIGQIMGLLPPIPAITAIVSLFMISALHDGYLVGWQNWLADWQRTLLNMVAGIVATLLLYSYFYYVGQTSQERGQLVAELQASHRELEKARQKEAELAVLRERERMARELHDGLGHTLVTLSMQLEAIQRLYRVDPERASGQVDQMKQLTRESMTELRHSVAGLRAPGLGKRPLPTALQTLITQFSQRTGIQVQSEIADISLPPTLAEPLWRIAQEALTNIEKHAQASHVSLILDATPGEIQLTIQDDGSGILPSDKAKPGHFGLRGMKERAETLNGTLKIESPNGQGTTIQVNIPLRTRHTLQP